MKKTRTTKVLCFGASLVLMLALAGCDQPPYHQACDAAAKISTSLAAVEAAAESAYDTHLIDKGEATAIAKGVIGATRCNDQFVASLRGVKTINAGNAKLASFWFAALTNCLNQLNNDALLGVKNEQARAQLSLAFQSAIATADIVAALIDDLNKQSAPAAPAPSGVSGAAQKAALGKESHGPHFLHAARDRGFVDRGKAGGRYQAAARHDGRAVACRGRSARA